MQAPSVAHSKQSERSRSLTPDASVRQGLQEEMQYDAAKIYI